MTNDRGFTLAAIMIFMMALSIFMAVAVPAYRMQAQRELEEELIFRGQEYVRAIQKYQRRFGIYPPSIEALMETNGLRFLRRQYTDPITGEGFRLLTINPDGSINGSTLYQQRVGNAPLFQGGTPQMFGQPGFGEGGSAQQQGGGGFGGQGRGQPGRGGQQAFSGGFSQQSLTGGVGFGQQQAGVGGQQQAMASSGLVGVAPENEDTSLKAYNNREKYNEWEFIAMPGFGTVPVAPTAAQGQDSPYAKGNFQIETRFRVSRPSVQECPCQTFQERNRTLE